MKLLICCLSEKNVVNATSDEKLKSEILKSAVITYKNCNLLDVECWPLLVALVSEEVVLVVVGLGRLLSTMASTLPRSSSPSFHPSPTYTHNTTTTKTIICSLFMKREPLEPLHNKKEHVKERKKSFIFFGKYQLNARMDNTWFWPFGYNIVYTPLWRRISAKIKAQTLKRSGCYRLHSLVSPESIGYNTGAPG